MAASAAASDVVFDVQRTVGAACERLAKDLLHPRRTGGTDHHLAAMLLAKAQAFLERIGVGFIHLVGDILLSNPGLVVAKPRLPLAGGHLLDADGDLHGRDLGPT